MAEFDLFKEVDAAWHRLTQYPGPDYDKPSFRMGFEACAELLGKLGWHPATEPSKEWHYEHFIEAREVFLFVTKHKLMPGEFVPFKDCSGVALMYYSDKRLQR